MSAFMLTTTHSCVGRRPAVSVQHKSRLLRRTCNSAAVLRNAQRRLPGSRPCQAAAAAEQPDQAPAPASSSSAAGKAEAAGNLEELSTTLNDPRLREKVLARAKDAVVGSSISKEELESIVSKLAAQKPAEEGAVSAPEADPAAQAALEAVEAQLATLKTQHLRLTADFDNFRKRTEGEKAALRERVRGDVVEQLFPLVDSFEQAKSQVKAESVGELKVERAYQGLYKQMLDVFRSLGVEAVPGEGSPFDPNVHDAIMRAESDEVPDGTVLKEFRRGFMCGGKLLRPAMVQVSFSNAPAASNNGTQDGQGQQAEGEVVDTTLAEPSKAEAA